MLMGFEPINVRIIKVHIFTFLTKNIKNKIILTNITKHELHNR